MHRGSGLPFLASPAILNMFVDQDRAITRVNLQTKLKIMIEIAQ